jgi:integrase
MGIFKKRGEWWIGYPLGNGRYRREVVGPSHALAKEILAKRLTEIAEDREFPQRKLKTKAFEEVVARFWELHGQYLLSVSWECMLRQLKAHFKNKRIADIGTAEVQRYYNLVAARTSNSTANRHLTLLRSIFNKAKAWGDFHGDNPCAMVKKQREAAHRLRYLSQEEIESILACAHSRLYPILVCALLTGMRRGEILGLDWKHVNLDRDILYVLKSKSGKPP